MPRNPEAAKTGRRALVTIVSALAVLLVVAGGVLWLVTAPPAGATDIGGPFTLVDGAGKQVTERDFRGKYMLVYFGYTFCPDVCPTTLQKVTAAMNVLGPKADQVTPIFISVDPKRDTPKVIGDYVHAFTPRLVGLTGDQAQIAAVEKEYRVYAAAQPADASGDYYGRPQLGALPHGTRRTLPGADPRRRRGQGDRPARSSSTWQARPAWNSSRLVPSGRGAQ